MDDQERMQEYDQERFERDYWSCQCNVCNCLHFVHIDGDTVCEECRNGEHMEPGFIDNEEAGE